MKKLLAFLVLAALLLLPACGKGTVTFKDDVSAAQIMDASASLLASYSQLGDADEDYMTYRMLFDPASAESYSVRIQNAGTSIDEIGIFQVAGEDTSAVTAMVEDYLVRRNEEWTGQYLVEEYPKLENAEYRVMGRYVVYGILSEADKETLFNAVECYLTAE